MHPVIVRTKGFGKKEYRHPFLHRDIKAEEIGTGNVVYIRCSYNLKKTEYFSNVYDNVVGVKRSRQKNNGVKLPFPEVVVSFVRGNEAELVHNFNDILSVTHPELGRLENEVFRSIDNAFHDQDFSKLKGIMVYDPASYEADSDNPYKFMSIARTRSVSKQAINNIPSFDSGSGEAQKSLWVPNQWHPQRLIGKRYAVPTNDFMDAKAPQGMLYVPIEGIAKGQIPDDIGMMVLACCTNAFFLV